MVPGGRTAILTSDDAGAEALLAAPIEPGPSMPVRFKVRVKGTKVEATVGETTLRGTLPATMAKGDVGLVAKRGASVEVTRFTLKKEK